MKTFLFWRPSRPGLPSLALGVTCPPRYVGLLLTKNDKSSPLHLIGGLASPGTSAELCTISDAVCSSSRRRLNRLPGHPKGDIYDSYMSECPIGYLGYYLGHYNAKITFRTIVRTVIFALWGK